MKPVSIYCLRDPRYQSVRYVGRTEEPEQRFDQHCNPGRGSGNSAKDEWIADLKALGLEPIFEVLEVCEYKRADKRERWWIQAMKDRGFRLLNGRPTTHSKGEFVTADDLEAIRRLIKRLMERIQSLSCVLGQTARINAKEIQALDKAYEWLLKARWKIEVRIDDKREEQGKEPKY